jgi:hypothetical protein
VASVEDVLRPHINKSAFGQFLLKLLCIRQGFAFFEMIVREVSPASKRKQSSAIPRNSESKQNNVEPLDRCIGRGIQWDKNRKPPCFKFASQ